MTKKIAFVSAMGLGDGLLSMTVVNNLKQQGYAVTIFRQPIWGKNIALTPTIPLPSGSLCMKYWKNLFTVSKVLGNFEKLLSLS